MTGDGSVIEFHTGELELAAGHLTTRAKAVKTAMNDMVDALKPMRATWVASQSAAGVAAGAAETTLRGAIDDIVLTVTSFAKAVTAGSTMQRELDDRLALDF